MALLGSARDNSATSVVSFRSDSVCSVVIVVSFPKWMFRVVLGIVSSGLGVTAPRGERGSRSGGEFDRHFLMLPRSW